MMKNRIGTFGAILVIVLTGILFSYRHLNEFPSHIHAWAQSDRYALSLGFVENNLNFFRPQTYVMNHQFPGDWKIPAKESITAVDFPVHDYIPAVIMKITNSRSPWIFRLYILFYSFTGLYFLFRISRQLGNGTIKSLFLVLLAATSPVFAYYQAGFLPTIPSLANALIGIFFYIRYLEDGRRRNIILAYVFLTLAALSRLSFAIPFIAVSIMELTRIFRKTEKSKSSLVIMGLSLLLLISWFLYNTWLSKKYGSMFLNHALPPSGVSNALELIKTSLKNWGKDYFTLYHYPLFACIFLAWLFFSLTSKTKIEERRKQSLWLILLILAGASLFSLMMLKQFPAHDYYFLDTLFLPVLLLIAWMLARIPGPRTLDTRITMIVILAIAGIFIIKKTLLAEEIRTRTGYWDRNTTTLNNFTGSAAYLDSLGISRSARIVVTDAYSPNIPFILMDRKGFAVMSQESRNIQNALDWGADYFVAQDDYFIPEVYAAYPGILSRLEMIAGNGKITVCRIVKNSGTSDLFSFFRLREKVPVYVASMDFDSTFTPEWRLVHPTEAHAHSGTCGGYLAPEDEFGLTYQAPATEALSGKPDILVLTAWFLHDTIRECMAVATLRKNDSTLFYKSYDLSRLLVQRNRWEKVTLIYQLPGISPDSTALSVYIWNKGKDSLYYDDFILRLY